MPFWPLFRFRSNKFSSQKQMPLRRLDYAPLLAGSPPIMLWVHQGMTQCCQAFQFFGKKNAFLHTWHVFPVEIACQTAFSIRPAITNSNKTILSFISAPVLALYNRVNTAPNIMNLCLYISKAGYLEPTRAPHLVGARTRSGTLIGSRKPAWQSFLLSFERQSNLPFTTETEGEGNTGDVRAHAEVVESPRDLLYGASLKFAFLCSLRSCTYHTVSAIWARRPSAW